MEEALKAIEYHNVSTIQIIFNMFRYKPYEEFFSLAREKNIGIIVRVPLASGMLTGKFDKDSTFSKHDHRFFNRHGMAFDKGETFSGVDYETGLKAVEELKKIFPDHPNLAPVALRWILMFDEVSCVIPGASKPEHLYSNIEASELPPLTENEMEDVKKIYDKYFRKEIYHLW